MAELMEEQLLHHASGHHASGERDPEGALLLNLENWEGPLDLLLSLARQQKVDLRQLSILDLVDQYLAFLRQINALKLEVAADYLVMAAWLTYLKSALLLPKDPAETPSPEEMALRLQLRLQRLNAMRDAAARLLARDRIGRDNFLRGNAEGLKDIQLRRWDASLFDILHAYGQVKLRAEVPVHVISRRPVMSLDMALSRLQSLLDVRGDWADLAEFLPPDFHGDLRRSATASLFLAALELARQGKAELRQEEDFVPIFIRAKAVSSQAIGE